MEIFGQSIPLPDFPVRKDISGLGMSDSDNYSQILVERLNFVNTFYDHEPYLDITCIHPDQEQKYDFVLSSDVFEHVIPPIADAFDNAFKLLRPGGLFVFTVPYLDNPGAKTIEHYPELHRFEIIKRDEKFFVSNYTKDAVYQEFSDPTFHGGDGQTLEMRFFEKDDVIALLNNSGFVDIVIHYEDVPGFGIFWHETQHSWPITARRPKQ